MITCSFCRGPFHIATGDLVGHQDYPFCGACVKEMRVWLRGHLNRKWNKTSFYAHATVPPPAVEKTYEFTVYVLVPGTKCTFLPIKVEKTGVHLDEALHRLSQEYPDHHIAEHTHGLWKEVT